MPVKKTAIVLLVFSSLGTAVYSDNQDVVNAVPLVEEVESSVNGYKLTSDRVEFLRAVLTIKKHVARRILNAKRDLMGVAQSIANIKAKLELFPIPQDKKQILINTVVKKAIQGVIASVSDFFEHLHDNQEIFLPLLEESYTLHNREFSTSIIKRCMDGPRDKVREFLVTEIYSESTYKELGDGLHEFFDDIEVTLPNEFKQEEHTNDHQQGPDEVIA